MIRRSLFLLPALFLALPLMGAEGTDWSAVLSCDFYWDGDYQKALQEGQEILAGDASLETKVEAAKCVASSQMALDQPEPAKQTITEMLAMDASARFSPDFAYTPAVINAYHEVREEVSPGTMDIKTIAVGDFENNSVYTGKFKDLDFGLFAPALVHLITADLAVATPLAIVDRQRTETIVKELELGRSGFADPESAVQAGKLLGAHTFIFGQYMVLSKDTVRIDARVVHTATGEIVLTESLTGEFSGDPQKFMELESRLVLALAEGIERIAEKAGESLELMQDTKAVLEDKAERAKTRPEYVQAALLAGRALEEERGGDMDAAKETWHQVQEQDPEHETAGLRLQLLSSLSPGR